MKARILVVYDTTGGNAHTMAVETITGAESILRRVPKVSPCPEATSPAVPDAGAPYVEQADLQGIDGLILGGPTHFGNFLVISRRP